MGASRIPGRGAGRNRPAIGRGVGATRMTGRAKPRLMPPPRAPPKPPDRADASIVPKTNARPNTRTEPATSEREIITPLHAVQPHHGETNAAAWSRATRRAATATGLTNQG